MTNAVKAGIIAAINAALGLAVALGAPLTDVQTGAMLALGNAVLSLFVLVTYKDSPKRIPDV